MGQENSRGSNSTKFQASAQPIALQLRFLQPMKKISGENNTTTFLPLPMELFTPFMKHAIEGGAAKS